MRVTVPVFIIVVFVFYSCAPSRQSNRVNVLSAPAKAVSKEASPEGRKPVGITVFTHELLKIDRREFVDYAKQFLGTNYLYASADPAKGFDCSGLLYHVFRHFNVKPPRTSYDYENTGEEIGLENAKPGDLILFTTPGDTTRTGHIGIITSAHPLPEFIHASTSKGVIISRFAGYYVKHFVKVIRVLK